MTLDVVSGDCLKIGGRAAVTVGGGEPRRAGRRIVDTQAALDRRAFDAPRHVNSDEIFRDQDRLEFAERHLARGQRQRGCIKTAATDASLSRLREMCRRFG
jgi:hypothetical protein